MQNSPDLTNPCQVGTRPASTVTPARQPASQLGPAGRYRLKPDPLSTPNPCFGLRLQGLLLPALFWLALVAGLLHAPLPALSKPTERNASHLVGFKLLAAWDQEAGEDAEFILWYPASKKGGKSNIGEWKLNASRDAPEQEGIFPLLVISHDSGANKLSYNDTATELARAGFAVATPTHRTDNTHNLSGLFTAEQIFNRPKEIEIIIKKLQEPEYAKFVNTKEIALIGIGAGASTALILAGAMVDISSYAAYCNANTENDPYCSDWVKQRLTTLSFSLPQPGSNIAQNIKALALVVPGYSMLFTQKSLQDVRCPAIIFDGEKREGSQGELLRHMLPNVTEFITLPDMNARSIAALCPEALSDGPVWECEPAQSGTLSKRQNLFNTNLLNFLNQNL